MKPRYLRPSIKEMQRQEIIATRKMARKIEELKAREAQEKVELDAMNKAAEEAMNSIEV
jgi:hypothetical protein